ncbi:CHAT domain-containing protein [Streptomyces sp. B6B3]|uniref:CHAT domain-containing protein n=1 Tax=Streptomyces sp. B6B3 TaxID=3153570 RepID=UPI00325D3003
MTDERDRALAAVRERLAEAQESEDPWPLFGAEADAEVRALLVACDPTRDLEARWAAGWLFFGRAAALPAGRGGEPGAAAGTLLFPVWAADPSAVPEPLARWFAATPREAWPDPTKADGPAEWAASSVACVIAAEGRQHIPPRGASAAILRLHALAAEFAASGLGFEALLHSAVGGGILAHLGTPDRDLAYPIRVLEYALDAVDRYRGVPGTPAPGDAPLPDDEATREVAVRLTRETLGGAPDDSGDRLEAVSALAFQLHDRYLVERRPEDLAEGIRVGRELLGLLPAGHPVLERARRAVGFLLVARLEEEAGAPAAYDEAVGLLRRALPGAPNGPSDRAMARWQLATALLLRYSRTARRQDLDEAVGLLGEALAGPWTETGPRVEVLVTLGNALRLRFQATGDPAELNAAIGHLTEVLGAAGEVTPGTVQRLHVPAMALYNRYGVTGDAADLDRALSLLRRAAALLPAGHPTRPSVLNHLGLALIDSHHRTGDAGELAEAVAALRESVNATQETHPQLVPRLTNLSNALVARYRATGDSADLDELLRCRRRAAALPTLGGRDRTATMSATGLGLVLNAERGPAGTIPDEAIELLREAVRLTPPDDAKLPDRRLNLAIALNARQGAAFDSAELREARAQVDAALAALPDDSPRFPGALVVAAGIRLSSLTARWSRRTQDEAIALLRRAVAATPPGHVLRANRLTILADVVRLRHGGRLRGPGGRDRRAGLAEAAGLYREAALEEGCAPSERLPAARRWGETWAELGAWDRALEGFSFAVDLLPRVAPRELVGDDQELLLGDAAGLGPAAAACAVRRGRPGLAVRLLEQARGVLLSHAFDADSDLTRLRVVAPDLAHRFESLRDALDAARHGPGFLEEGEAVGAAGGGRPASADPRHQLAAEWRALVDTIRARHPDLGMFRPVGEWDESELRATSAEGPVVLVNVSPFGSDALVVTSHAVEAVPLPELDPSTVARHGASFQDALGRLDDPGTGRAESLRAQQEVRDTLDWLWRRIVGPVLDHLDLPASALRGPWPRLWWSPTGTLGTLPLHAAGPADGSPGALDRVVSSYTPTLRALRHARERAAPPPAGTGRLLVVAVVDTEGLPPLPAARDEAEQLGRLLPASTVLVDGAATRAAVVSALPGHAYAHFACHALGDLERPSGNRLVLHDHGERPLTVRDLARLRLPGVRLAYLSACDTLRTTPELADEAVHLVSAFQMAGFPHVVGSLWHVDDAIGARVAQQVYATLRAGAGGTGGLDVSGTASALHAAVRALRADYPLTPSLWACQVHLGP